MDNAQLPGPVPGPIPGPIPGTFQAPSTPKRQQITRDERIQILLLHDLKFTYPQIAEILTKRIGHKITQRAVQYAVNTGHLTPTKGPGRARLITPQRMDKIEAYIISRREGRQVTYA